MVRLNRARSASAAPTGPWATDEEEMCRKTAVRAASKYMPLSAQDFHSAVALDEAREVGRAVDMEAGEVIVEAEDVTEGATTEETAAPTPKKETKLDQFAAKQGAAKPTAAAQPTLQTSGGVTVITDPGPPAIPLTLKDGKIDWAAWKAAFCTAVKAAKTAADIAILRQANAENMASFGITFPVDMDDVETFIEEQVAAKGA
jgi:hypothetical protein